MEELAMETGRSAWCWGWTGIGVLAALCVAIGVGATRRAQLAPPGPVRVWAADRDGCELYALDADLILAQRTALGWPLELARARDGGLYVLRAVGGSAGTGQRLARIDARGVLTGETDVGTCLDLDTFDGRMALLVEQPGERGSARRALRIAPEGASGVLAQSPALRCIAGSRFSVLVGTDDGWVDRLPIEGGRPLASVRLSGAILDLAPGPEAGSVFALAGDGTRLCLLGPDLALRWDVALPIVARHLGAAPDAERVWLGDTRSARVLRYGPGGALEIDRDGLPLAGLDRALPWIDGGALLCAPGAILHLDSRGHLAPGQGGFNFLVGLAR
jgi:hypothetical protein